MSHRSKGRWAAAARCAISVDLLVALLDPVPDATGTRWPCRAESPGRWWRPRAGWCRQAPRAQRSVGGAPRGGVAVTQGAGSTGPPSDGRPRNPRRRPAGRPAPARRRHRGHRPGLRAPMTRPAASAASAASASSRRMDLAYPRDLVESTSSVFLLAQSNSAARSCGCFTHVYGDAADRGERTRRYPSDLMDAEWAVVRPLLPVPAWLGAGAAAGGLLPPPDARRHLRPRGQRRQVACPACRFLHMGPGLRLLPPLVAPWSTGGFPDRLCGRVRHVEDRSAEPAAAVMTDSQSVRSASANWARTALRPGAPGRSR